MALLASSVQPTSQARQYVYAWLCASLFYFFEYLVRSAPAVMIPELSSSLGISPLSATAVIGSYYYTYAVTSLIAGVLLDQFGAKYIVPAGMALLGVGCLMFAVPNLQLASAGRLFQGAGSAFAFTGAVYLASNGLPAQRLATAIGVTQCIGMLGGSVGQLAVGPIIHAQVSVGAFWSWLGIVIMLFSTALLYITPTRSGTPKKFEIQELLSTYKVVFSNPQSFVCGAIAGLLFAPTTILDMVWGVRFLQVDDLFSYQSAVVASAMVPLGWVFGCPLFGYLADALPRRRMALVIGALLMLACVLQITFLRSWLPVGVTLFILGLGSGAAMIPYTIIKEVNPDNVKGSATGGINFMNFAVASLIGPLFAQHYGKALGVDADPAAHLLHTNVFWIGVICLALLFTLVLRERVGRGATTA